ncbi:MAG TPA: hypothetical protein DCQ97_12255 [Chitinophagaceae bacterium]|nr:hypothetical protein [Chitinophagaceae bacterium]
MKTLGYFDLFQYPLTREEIRSFHAVHLAYQELDAALDSLLEQGLVFRLDEFYSVQPNSLLAERRRKGNQLAARHLQTASKVARFLSGFPYVKGIAVSGSLSKNFATSQTDIDFFIVTHTNRLWIARTFMHLYKKFTFLTGRQHWYCMNYYVDEKEMEIKEKNIFTAMESVTLLPMQGKETMEEFVKNNHWIKEYFPSKTIVTEGVSEIKPGLFRRLAEKVFNNSMGDKVDTWLMKLTEKRWKKKTEKRLVNNHGHVMSMVVDRHFSKPDPRNFQHKVVEQYRQKVQQLLHTAEKTPSLVL